MASPRFQYFLLLRKPKKKIWFLQSTKIPQQTTRVLIVSVRLKNCSDKIIHAEIFP